MKEIMIKTIKEDIKYMLTELGNMRKVEINKDTKNKLMENSGLSQDAVGYIVYIKDFRPYRKMVDSLSKLYDSLNQMYKYNMLKGDKEFVEYVVSSLFAESKELHKLMETCKEDYDQYRCMSDAYVKLTDKICRIERDKPNVVPEIKINKEDLEKVSEYFINKISNNISTTKHKWDNSRSENTLLKHQQEAVDFEGANLICDWTRNSGKSFTIAKIIELKKPENVLYIDNIGSNYESFNTLCDKFKDINYLDKTGIPIIEVKKKTPTKLTLLIHDLVDYSSEVNVYSLKSLHNGDIDNNTVFDYVFFAECLPYNLGVKSLKSISFISYNDSDGWLERFYPNCKISKSDYKPLVEIGMLTQKTIDSCRESNYKKFLNEYAILD